MSQVPKNVFSSPPLTNHMKNSTHESAMARWFALTNEPPGKQWLMGEGKKLRSSILWPPLPSAGSKAWEDEIWGQVKYHGMLRQHTDNSCPERCSGTATCCFCLMMIFLRSGTLGSTTEFREADLGSIHAKPDLILRVSYLSPCLTFLSEMKNVIYCICLTWVTEREMCM